VRVGGTDKGTYPENQKWNHNHTITEQILTNLLEYVRFFKTEKVPLDDNKR
jgi:hypothetical protein